MTDATTAIKTAIKTTTKTAKNSDQTAETSAEASQSSAKSRKSSQVLSDQFLHRSNMRSNSIAALNMAYLNLARALIAEDSDSAKAYLGLSEQTCQLILSLSEAQRATLCQSGRLLCSLNLTEETIHLTQQQQNDKANTDPVYLAIQMLNQAVL